MRRSRGNAAFVGILGIGVIFGPGAFRIRAQEVIVIPHRSTSAPQAKASPSIEAGATVAPPSTIAAPQVFYYGQSTPGSYHLPAPFYAPGSSYSSGPSLWGWGMTRESRFSPRYYPGMGPYSPVPSSL